MLTPLVIDITIIIILLFYTFDGYRRGVLLLVLELLGTLLAFYLALRYATPVGHLINTLYPIHEPLQKVSGFFTTWIVSEILVALLLRNLYQRIPNTIRQSEVNRILGTIPSAAKGLLSIAIVLTLITALPVDSAVKARVNASRIGNYLVSETQKVEQHLAQKYHKELEQALTFITTTPFTPKIKEKNETISLKFKTTQVSLDTESETRMLQKVNRERLAAGLKILKMDPETQVVARLHGKDMFAKGYFSHVNPDNQDPFDRLASANITYLTAGENLALAPTLDLAHIGLMNSPKHKENILFPDFGRVGIGVIDGGVYGKMFVQIFRNE